MISSARTAVLLAMFALAGAPAAAQAAGGASRYNGTWKVRLGSSEQGGHEANSELRIWALDEHRLRLEFYGSFEYKTGIGRTVNNGQASGVAALEGGKVVFRSEREGECGFTLHLHLRGEGTLVVRQSGNACFGFNVTAAGTYRRASTARPTFELPVPPDTGAPPAPGTPVRRRMVQRHPCYPYRAEAAATAAAPRPTPATPEA